MGGPSKPPKPPALGALRQSRGAPRPRDSFTGSDTIVTLLARNAAERPDKPAMREKDLGIWQEWTWRAYLDEVLAVAAGLEALGFGPGDALLVLGDNRPQMYFGMVAASALRGRPTPIFPDAIPAEIVHIAGGVTARFALVEDQEQVDKLLALEGQLAGLEHILYDDPRGLGGYRVPGLVSCAEVRARGRERLAKEPALEADLVRRARPDDPVALFHSSGTTGAQKAIVLTHAKFLAVVRGMLATGMVREGDETLAYLPMAWVGDFVFSVAAPIAARAAVNIPERPETLLADMRETGPTCFFAPPRIWDQMRTRIEVFMADAPRLKKVLYRRFVGVAMQRARLVLEGRPLPWSLSVANMVGETLILAPLRDQLGLARVERVFTGGEALGEDTFTFFRAVGINAKQLYGQTEGSALYTVQPDDEVRLHTVGKPIPGVEMRVDENGELLVRSAGMFDGYLGNPKASRDSFVDGWFRTGDAGYIEKDGHVVVLGRVQEVARTAAGERYVPNYIENRLKFSPCIKDAAVVGAGREFLTAMVCIDFEAVGHWAELEGIPYTSYADLSQKPRVHGLIAREVERVNRVLPEALKLRRFVNLHKDFDPDDGEITRTRKLRRAVIEQRYDAIIAALYGGDATVDVDVAITYETGEVGRLKRTLAIQEVAAP
jgi:long-chain acyl-CoA synthetase